MMCPRNGTAPKFASALRRIVSWLPRPITALTTRTEQTTANQSTYELSRRLLLRALGIVLLIAIASLWLQVEGLMGPQGIAPVGDFLELAQGALGAEAYWLLPTICWLESGAAMLHALCAVGTVMALMLIFDVAPGPALACLWAIYLSLMVAGQTFLSFQWDSLLLESSFVALFWAPWRFGARNRCDGPPGLAGLCLLRILLFKLMFLSGVTKLLCGDLPWHEWTALDVHFETQPLPTWIGWYAHQLPSWFQKLSVAVMFMIEILVPFCIVCPRWLRHPGAALMLCFQLLIALSGNYGFFNLLTMTLCIPLFDDSFLARLARRRNRRAESPHRAHAASWRRLAPVAVATFAIGAVSTLAFVEEMVRTLRSQQRSVQAGAALASIPGPVVGALDICDTALLSWGRPAILKWVGPWRTINGYGLFRNMTTQRPEIAVEGSRDGRRWHRYRFKWKPGDPGRRPGFVAPHQPRLDWQMWFAALHPAGHAHWLTPLAERLLRGHGPAVKLLASNPFPEQPPRHLRFVFYEYRFTDFETRRRTGDWWQRRLVRRSQSFTLEDFQY